MRVHRTGLYSPTISIWHWRMMMYQWWCDLFLPIVKRQISQTTQWILLFLCFIHSPGSFLISECRHDFEWVENRKRQFEMCLGHIWTTLAPYFLSKISIPVIHVAKHTFLSIRSDRKFKSVCSSYGKKQKKKVRNSSVAM